LRYEGTDLELSLGEFTVGRSSSCSLALDDGLVSRQHAAFRVSESDVFVRDLGSRNGVSVNDKRVVGEARVRHLDRVKIGGTEFVLMERQAASPAQTLQIERCLKCGALNEPSALGCAQCGARLGGQSATLRGQTLGNDDFQSVKSGAASFLLLAPIADKGLALKRYDEAHRLLHQPLEQLRESLQQGESIDPSITDRGVGLALHLVHSKYAAHWLTWLFEVLAIRKRLIDSDAVEALHEAARSSRYRDPKPLRRYLDAMRTLDLSASQRFTLRRLEALERVIAA
jgi:ribosomal protein L40E